MGKILGLLLTGILLCTPAYPAQLQQVDTFKGLERDPGDDKITDFSHSKFDNVYINDGNIQVVKGRDKLNATANADLVAKGMWYYENAAGTVKK